MTPNISLNPDVIAMIGPFAITNSFLGAVLITFGFIALTFMSVRKMGIVPTRLQVGFELLFEYILDQLRTAFGSEARARKFFPLIMTLLLFIIVANQLTVIPLLGQIIVGGKSIFRLPTADLTQTIAFAILMVGLANVLAFSISPLRQIGRFIKFGEFLKVRSVGDFFHAILEFFLGLLDIVGEIAKVLSLSFRLFGNMFAGEVMVIVIVSLTFVTQFIVPMPFLLLGMFSGLIQAFVFTLLSIQFIAGTLASVEGET